MVNNDGGVMIRKKNSGMMTSCKKRMRNNSGASLKSSTSSISEYSVNKADNSGPKSTFANAMNWNDKEECNSELMRELIKSLVHLMEV